MRQLDQQLKAKNFGKAERTADSLLEMIGGYSSTVRNHDQ